MTPSRILIVEDESIVALDLQARLSRLGFQVVGIAGSGSQALALAEQEHPDLALMDIRLRGDMDGIETAHQMRAQFDTPVVYLTAHTDEATLARAKVTEPFGYLVKPLEERELHSTLDMALYKIETDKQLKRQAAQLERIVTAVPEGIALLDSDHRLLVANPAAADFLFQVVGIEVGDTVSTIGGRAIESFILADENESWGEVAITIPTARIFEVRALRASQAPKATGFSVPGRSDLVLVSRDVTKDREVQRRILLQDRLATIGQFSAGIAHDFNNILSVIILNSRAVQRGEPGLRPESQRYLDLICNQAKRASDLIKQILDYSRASAMNMKTFELLTPLREQLHMIQRIVPDHIRMRLEAPDAPTLIKGDQNRILEVLMNLIINARDAMPNGGLLRVVVSQIEEAEVPASDKQSPDGWVRLSVIDTGTGIPDEVLPHIFEPFFTTKAPDKGSGLGLPQVHGIVEQHGGFLEVQTQVGIGTSMSAYFPRIKLAVAGPAAPSPDYSGNVVGNKQTLLIAEDNADTRQGLADLLRMHDYVVLTSSTGREALTVLENSSIHIDLLISDLMMPDMGGLELLQYLRQKRNPIKAIIVTGHASQDTLVELQQLGISGWLIKPVELDELTQVVWKTLHA